ncbi:hypothetical protein TNCV_2114181 [Trichonephila clavipes]|nr:hypothetical protein TNCV_2114181 [Trichonephila clavipes]
MSSSLVPLKIRSVRQRYTLNLSRAQMSSRWCGVGVKRGQVRESQHKCRPHHLPMIQKFEVRHKKPSSS